MVFLHNALSVFFFFLLKLVLYCFLSSSQGNPVLESGISDPLTDPPPLSNSGNHIESNYDTVSSHIDTIDKTTPDSKALVALPAMSMEALAVAPLNQKTRHSELVQRRTRRPFSVSEVEALVHAVEELGTGRCDVLHHLLALLESSLFFLFLFFPKKLQHFKWYPIPQVA
jgi:hypothetical protein